MDTDLQLHSCLCNDQSSFESKSQLDSPVPLFVASIYNPFLDLYLESIGGVQVVVFVSPWKALMYLLPGVWVRCM